MDTKEFLINKSYGGFGYSQVAIDEYNRRMKSLDKNFNPVRSQCPDYQDIPRDDPVMIQIVKEFGTRANDKWSNLQIVSVPYEYYIGVEIEEYEGMERWKINFPKYKLHKIEHLLFSPRPDYEKITHIYSIISANITLQNFSNELNI